MLVDPNTLIEQFASMLEDEECLDETKFAKRTLDIFLMLNKDPSLTDTMSAINAQIRTIVSNAEEIKLTSQLTGHNAKKFAANQIRALKTDCVRH